VNLPQIFNPRTEVYALFVASSLGLLGWIGVFCLICAAVALWIITPSVERSNFTDLREIDAMNRHWVQLRDPKSGGAHTQRDTIAGFIDALPPASAVPDFLASLQRRADEAAVQIDRTEYRIQPVVGYAAQRYRLSFPAHVDYPHLRTWLEALLHDYPSLALEELSLHREVDGGEELDAHIGLSFLVREVK